MPEQPTKILINGQEVPPKLKVNLQKIGMIGNISTLIANSPKIKQQ